MKLLLKIIINQKNRSVAKNYYKPKKIGAWLKIIKNLKNRGLAKIIIYQKNRSVAKNHYKPKNKSVAKNNYTPEKKSLA